MSGTTPQWHKKGAVSLSLLRKLKVPLGGTTPSDPPSQERRDSCGCHERFPRKDPEVFDLLGSSLSCDATCLRPPDEYLRLRFAELLPERYRWKERLHPGADRHAVLNNLSDHWVTGGRAVLKVLLGIAIVFSSTPTRR